MLADRNNWPVVVHCTAGKDRTGFSVAALLWTLGISEHDVIADYLRSNETLDQRHAAILEQVRARGLDPTVLQEMLQCTPEYLAAGREAAIELHGSLDAWVNEALRIDDDTRQRWQHELLK